MVQLLWEVVGGAGAGIVATIVATIVAIAFPLSHTIKWPKNPALFMISSTFRAVQQRWHSSPLWARAYLWQASRTALYGCFGGGWCQCRAQSAVPSSKSPGQELCLVGERLHYKRQSGRGPEQGWVWDLISWTAMLCKLMLDFETLKGNIGHTHEAL